MNCEICLRGGADYYNHDGQTVKVCEVCQRHLIASRLIKIGPGVEVSALLEKSNFGEGRQLEIDYLDDPCDDSLDAIPFRTGFPTLDEHLGGGLRPGSLVVVTGAVGTGKSNILKSMWNAQYPSHKISPNDPYGDALRIRTGNFVFEDDVLAMWYEGNPYDCNVTGYFETDIEKSMDFSWAELRNRLLLVRRDLIACNGVAVYTITASKSSDLGENTVIGGSNMYMEMADLVLHVERTKDGRTYVTGIKDRYQLPDQNPVKFQISFSLHDGPFEV